MKEQIEKMAKDVVMSISWCDEEILTIDCLETATLLYDKVYRKQSEGEWKPSPSGSTNVYCSLCGAMSGGGIYCSHCGAKMKGGAE